MQPQPLPEAAPPTARAYWQSRDFLAVLYTDRNGHDRLSVNRTRPHERNTVRIRSIVPKFWRSDDIDSLDWHTRLVFIGLWSYVDDNGVGLDKLSAITADLFAHDFSVDPTETLRRVSLALDELSLRGMLTRYSAVG